MERAFWRVAFAKVNELEDHYREGLSRIGKLRRALQGACKEIEKFGGRDR